MLVGPGQAYSSLQAACEAAVAGDVIGLPAGVILNETVLLTPTNSAEGIYDDSADGETYNDDPLSYLDALDASETPIVIVAQYPARLFPDRTEDWSGVDSPATDNGTYAIGLSKKRAWRIDGLWVRGGQDAAIGVIGGLSPQKPCHRIRIENCDAKPMTVTNGAGSTGEDGIKFAQCTKLIVRNNKAEGVSDQGMDWYGCVIFLVEDNESFCPVQAGAVFKAGCARGIVRNNSFSSTTGNGARAGDASVDNFGHPDLVSVFYPDGAAYDPAAEQAEVLDIVFTGNTLHSAGSYAIVFYGAKGCSSIGDIVTVGTGSTLANIRQSLNNEPPPTPRTDRWNSTDITTDLPSGNCLVADGSTVTFI